MNRRLTLPERILQHLGVERPGDIDIEAIAWELGALVRYRTLHSCEARVIGRGDKAIITVDDRVAPRRRRFSIGHELGHWHYHRGRCLICRTEDIGNRRKQANDPEHVADDYASDLLLPRYLLEPMLRDYARPTLKAMREVADAFNTSLTATIIKVIETNRYPVMLVCHGQQGRRWFKAAASVPSRWFPNCELDPDSFAFQLLFGDGPEETFPRSIGADAWFDRRDASDYEILEQSYRLPNKEVATVLFCKDPKMLEEWDTTRRYGS